MQDTIIEYIREVFVGIKDRLETDIEVAKQAVEQKKDDSESIRAQLQVITSEFESLEQAASVQEEKFELKKNVYREASKEAQSAQTAKKTHVRELEYFEKELSKFKEMEEGCFKTLLEGSWDDIKEARSM